MATLVAPRWDAVTPGAQRLLLLLGQLPALRGFYLGGGTALALRLGHRISQDVDLFANIEGLGQDLRRTIVGELRKGGSVEVLQDSPLGLVVQVNGQSVSFFSYGYPLLESGDLVSGIEVASLVDIGLMKLDAIAGRGMRKDFYDLYFIAPRVSLEQLFSRSDEKYAQSRGFRIRTLTALVDFDIADQQEEPILLVPAPWHEVKAFFEAEARRLGQEWLGPNEPDSAR